MADRNKVVVEERMYIVNAMLVTMLYTSGIFAVCPLEVTSFHDDDGQSFCCWKIA